MSLFQPLFVRLLTMLAVLLVVLALLVISLGATGFSDRMLEAVISEELRTLRPTLGDTIRDPDELERVLTAHRAELRVAYGLEKPWYTRLPDKVAGIWR